MKKTLLSAIILIFITLNFSFQTKSDLEINKTLLCKQWQTDARDDVRSKVIIVFNQNYTYSHSYFNNGLSKQESILMTGKWSIGKDKKIYIEFDKSNIKEVFNVVSIKENELVMNTVSGLKKFESIK